MPDNKKSHQHTSSQAHHEHGKPLENAAGKAGIAGAAILPSRGAILISVSRTAVDRGAADVLWQFLLRLSSYC